ncbi:MAG: DUF402 domain-containing protein [Gemmatimonadota bacterium]|jgi:predicted RNA-binding protein associated with RNAse of E/G family|nr:DUF402 domain-containing protein [Gemmatimonadota bacterium]
MVPSSTIAEIHYQRPPDRIDIFHQRVLEKTDDHIVTFLESAGVRRVMLIHGEVVLEPGSPVIWFSFPELWYDIGLFHRADGCFTGWYANVLTPMKFLLPDAGGSGHSAFSSAREAVRPGPERVSGIPDTPAGQKFLRWETTDLFLDVWLGADGTLELLDQDEFDAAVTAGWIDHSTATTARATAESILERARAGDWPPPLTHGWTLAGVQASLRNGRKDSARDKFP